MKLLASILFARLLASVLGATLAAPSLAAHADATPAAVAPRADAVLPSTSPASEAAEPAFDIWEYEIEGNSVLPVAAVEQAVQPFLGPQLTMRSVESARAALESVYQQAGYLTVLVDIPEQRVDDGVVRLAVLEGRVGEVYVTGSRYHALGQIRHAVPALAAGSVPNFTDAQAQLAALNRTDDRRVAPVVKPGRLPGTVDLDLQVTDRLPWGGQFELNNQHAPETSDTRASATLRYDNLFQREHGVALTLQGAPEAPDESRVAVMNYTLPADDGDTWSLSYTVSNSRVETLGGTQAIGNGHTWGYRRHHSALQGGFAHTWSSGADLKVLRDRVAFGDEQLETPIRYVPFQLAYAGTWSQDRDSLQLNASLTAAWRRLLEREVNCGGVQQDQFACKTQGASGSFGVFRSDVRWSQPLAGGMLAVRLGAQIASGPLVSAEQYVLGGADTVRGYLEGEVSADHGLLGSFEWRLRNLAPTGEGVGGLRDARPVMFLDLGRGYIAQPLPDVASHPSLASAGLGLRASTAWLDGVVDVAWPAKTTPYTTAGDAHVHVRLVARY